jgi:hypothetical protein
VPSWISFASSSSSSLWSLSICWTSSESRLFVLPWCWWVWEWEWGVLWILVILGRWSVELECRCACSLVAIIAISDGNHTFIPLPRLYISWVSTSYVVVFGTKREIILLNPLVILIRQRPNHSKNEESREAERKIEWKRRRRRKTWEKQGWVVLYGDDRWIRWWYIELIDR